MFLTTYMGTGWKRRVLVCFAFLLFSVLLAFVSPPVAGVESTPDQPVVQPVGQQSVLLDIRVPITLSNIQSITRTLEKLGTELGNVAQQSGKQPILLLRFSVPENQEMYGRGSQFAPSFALATLLTSEKFRPIRTIAFLTQPIQGHALLPILACKEIILTDSIEVGNAGVDENNLTPTIFQAYRDVGHRFPDVFLAKLLDPSVELWSLETDSGTVWTDQKGLQQFRDSGKLLQEPNQPFLPSGEPGLFSSHDLRGRLAVADMLVSKKDGISEIAQVLAIPLEQIAFAGEFLDITQPVRIDLIGPITPSKIGEVQRQIQKAVAQRNDFPSFPNNRNSVESHDNRPADFICLWIDSPGGSLAESLNLAHFLAFDLDPNKVRTVAYIPNQARSDAAIIALGCQEIILGPETLFGGNGATFFSTEQIQDAVHSLSQSLAPKMFRHWSLPAAILDPELPVYQYTSKDNPARLAFFCEEELSVQKDPANWERGPLVTQPKTPFLAIGQAAVSFHLANRVVNDFKQFKQLFHLEREPEFLAPAWIDQMIQALAHPRLSVLLLMIGFAAFWAELKTPGIGVGAFIAICCFTLFFWSRFLGGTAGWLEVLLFLIGVLFLLLEIFVIPGFGLFGIGGGAAILASLVFASQTFIIPRNPYQLQQFQNSLLILVVALIGMSFIAYASLRLLHRLNKNGDMTIVREQEKLIDYSHLLGKQGVASTPLVPAGKGTFGVERVDVLADGELIEAGTPITVDRVLGYRVIVRKRV